MAKSTDYYCCQYSFLPLDVTKSKLKHTGPLRLCWKVLSQAVVVLRTTKGSMKKLIASPPMHHLEKMKINPRLKSFGF